ncbi:MAG: hypothetical protein IKF06_07340 [Lachnospiraceae bacterium]|nr:hypothetical protein [Lachnospiraceae bacterium]
MTDNKAKYEERMNRINTAIALKEPDRVPIIPFAQCYPVLHVGQGPIMDKMGLKFIQWAGQKGSIVPDNCIHQFVEKEELSQQ